MFLVSFDARYKPLLTRRIPRADMVIGRAYVIHARNGGVGVAVAARRTGLRGSLRKRMNIAPRSMQRGR